MTDILRTWLIAALTHDELPPLAATTWPELLAQADSEGVLVLLEHRLAFHPGYAALPADLINQIQRAAKHGLMDQLPFQSEQKKLFQALNQAQIPFLVMKGAALGNWLYDSPNYRPVTDIDLWFKDQKTVKSLAEILQPLGYIRIESSGGLTSFEQAFDKDFNGTKIRLDAHWALFNSAILSESVSYQSAYSRAMTVTIQGQNVKALGIIDALINSIGHRALKHLARQAVTLKWLYDQYLLFNTLEPVQWQELIARCAQAGISDLALEAIEQSQTNFKTMIPLSVIEALSKNAKNEKINRGWFQSWPRYQWQEMQAISPNFSIRMQWIVQKLWPNPEAMREGYGQNDSAWRFMLRRIGVGIRRLFG